MARLYPLFADVAGRKVLVVGGGGIAEEKITALLECEARVMVISPEVTEQIAEWERDKRLKIKRREYKAGDVKWAWLVIVACGVEEVDRQIHGECVQRRILCNVVDVTDLCIFQVPAVCKRGKLQIAISTAGISPALAKKIRQDLEKQFDPAYETLLDALGELREYIKGRYPENLEKRSQILTEFVHSEALELIRQEKADELRMLLERFRDM